MSHKESTCPFCGKRTDPYLPVYGYYPCPECVRTKYDNIGHTLEVKKEFAHLVPELDYEGY